MSTRRISQRSARALRQRVQTLEAILRRQQHAWAGEWVGGTDIGRCPLDRELRRAIHTARLLSHAVVVTLDGEVVVFHALPQKGVPL